MIKVCLKHWFQSWDAGGDDAKVALGAAPDVDVGRVKDGVAAFGTARFGDVVEFYAAGGGGEEAE